MSVNELRLKEIESLLYTMTRKVSSFCSSTYKKLSISYRQKRVMSIFHSTVVKTLFLNCCTKFIGFCFHFFSTCVIIYFKLRSLDRRSNEETSSSLCLFMYFFLQLATHPNFPPTLSKANMQGKKSISPSNTFTCFLSHDDILLFTKTNSLIIYHCCRFQIRK